MNFNVFNPEYQIFSHFSRSATAIILGEPRPGALVVRGIFINSTLAANGERKSRAPRAPRPPQRPAILFSIFFSAMGEVMGHRAHRALYVRRDLKASQGPQFRKDGCVDVYGGMFRSPFKNLWPRRRCQSRVRLGAARRIRECF